MNIKMFLILLSTHMTAMIQVQSKEMEPEPNHSSYLLKPTWNYIWSSFGLGPVKLETKSSLALSSDSLLSPSSIFPFSSVTSFIYCPLLLYP